MKRFLSLVLTMLLVVSGLYCASASAEGVVEIDFMHAETDEGRITVLQSIIDSFMAGNPGIKVNQMIVSEDDLWTKTAAMIVSGDLPAVVEAGTDMMRMMIAEETIDTAANTEVIELAGKDRFYTGALSLCKNGEDGYIGVPVSGWVSGIWYRKSWFAEKGLEAPTNWENILAAAKAFNDPANKVYGVVFPTDVSDFTEQIFNNFCASNEFELFDADGNAQIHTETMEQLLSYYTEQYQYGLPGSVGVEDVNDTLVGGHAAMGMYSTYILGALREAGLADDIGFAVPHNVADGGYGMTTTTAITADLDAASREAAVKFVAYMCSPDMNIIRCHMAAGGANPTLRDVATNPEYLDNEVIQAFSSIAASIPEAFESMGCLGFQNGIMHPAMGNISAKMIIPQCIYNITVGGADIKTEMAATQALIQAEVDAVR
ncbi:MAG: extracellular solute-binding protein [Clostridia bacterium]